MNTNGYSNNTLYPEMNCNGPFLIISSAPVIENKTTIINTSIILPSSIIFDSENTMNLIN